MKTTSQIYISFRNSKTFTTSLIGNNSTLTIESFYKQFTAVKCMPIIRIIP